MGYEATVKDLLNARTEATRNLFECPYDPRAYINIAECHDELGYPCLAAGDAYRALLLTDDIEYGEHQDEVLEALSTGRRKGTDVDRHDVDTAITSIAKSLAIKAYIILTKCLTACGDEQAALEFVERGLEVDPDEKQLQRLRTNMKPPRRRKGCQRGQRDEKLNLGVKKGLPRPGFARREIYPWNHHEPDRFSLGLLSVLNLELQTCSSNAEVRAVELPLLTNESLHDPSIIHRSGVPTVKQLGLFASRDIAPCETVLSEPSILTANNRLLEPLCDACSAPLPPLSAASPLPTCTSCDDIYFCSDMCSDRAQKTYHPAICGIEDFDIVAKDPSPAAATDALYLLLVVRTIAMAETQDKHPLDLPQIKYLWGDFTPPSAPIERTLPFTFQTNIAHPIHVLIRMNIDPFATTSLERYDLWVLNTLFAKFRGVASAKMNPHTLRPDVAAVHPLWSLANHSCAPNVRWQWGAEDGDLGSREKGVMGFIARGGKDVVNWGGMERSGGIKKGEEVLNHYCDIEMDVQKRREWAMGALGGVCQCERCLWEEDRNPPAQVVLEAATADDSVRDGQ